MAFQLPFQQGANSAQMTPSDVARRRLLAQQLAGNKVQDAGALGALANTLSGSLSGYENKQASEIEGKGQSEANALLAQVLANDNPTMATLSEVATNPWLGERQSSVVNALLGQTMERNDPAYQLDLDLKRAQIAAANAPAQPDPFTLGEGQIRYDGQGNIIAQGLAPGGPDTVVNNNLGQTDKFRETLDTESAKTFNMLMDAGNAAQVSGVKLGQLETLLQSAPQGAQGALTSMANSIGIPVEGGNEVQAAEALINQLVPAQRPVGSGTMSDADLALFKASLPRIINQPGGNQLILNTMKAINDYTVQQGKIATAVATGQMTPAQGREALYALPNPLEQARDTQGGKDPSGENWTDLGGGIRIRPLGQ